MKRYRWGEWTDPRGIFGSDPSMPKFEPRPIHIKIQGLDGMWMVSTSTMLHDVVKSGLTEEEADAWIRLLKEEG